MVDDGGRAGDKPFICLNLEFLCRPPVADLGTINLIFVKSKSNHLKPKIYGYLIKRKYSTVI